MQILFPEAIREMTPAYLQGKRKLEKFGAMSSEVHIIFSFVYQVQLSCLHPRPAAISAGLKMLRSWHLRFRENKRQSYLFPIKRFLNLFSPIIYKAYVVGQNVFFQIFWLPLTSESNLGTDELNKAKYLTSMTSTF